MQSLKETRNSYFCVTPKNHRLMFFSWKMLKSTVTKKVIVCFYNFRWRKFLKVAAYVIFPTSIMPLFEIYQRFKGYFFNELRVSFNKLKKSSALVYRVKRSMICPWSVISENYNCELPKVSKIVINTQLQFAQS